MFVRAEHYVLKLPSRHLLARAQRKRNVAREVAVDLKRLPQPRGQLRVVDAASEEAVLYFVKVVVNQHAHLVQSSALRRLHLPPHPGHVELLQDVATVFLEGLHFADELRPESAGAAQEVVRPVVLIELRGVHAGDVVQEVRESDVTAALLCLRRVLCDVALHLLLRTRVAGAMLDVSRIATNVTECKGKASVLGAVLVIGGAGLDATLGNELNIPCSRVLGLSRDVTAMT